MKYRYISQFNQPNTLMVMQAIIDYPTLPHVLNLIPKITSPHPHPSSVFHSIIELLLVHVNIEVALLL